ncbi:Pex19 protein family-domain-containing protein [Podospora didyma]|uniref:Pex19 protein family-domain-containing protein n=1 Tax=Podospora didyma TaxID=330526 RepID=A0AAE0KL57_9PEZI|nr:Pex19 protein family-domain-containing protein [Podospora didyma]
MSDIKPAGDIGASKEHVTQTTIPAPPPSPPVNGAVATTEQQPKPVTVEDDVDDVPDPDEDDLDDLDDMLDEFSAVNIESKKPEVAPGSGRPVSAGIGASFEEDAVSDDDFAKQLQAGMAGLLGEFEPEMQAQFESIFKELGAAAAAEGTEAASAATPAQPASGRPSASKADATAAEASFQDTIRKTMERMQEGGAQATAAAAAEGSDDFLAELLKQMQSGGLEGEGTEEDFSKMLMGMMDQLTNKEILYEPMKELHEKFPAWLEKNAATVAKDDLKRYQEQQGLVKEIVAKFEETTYSDSNKTDREYIVDRMQKMQASGSPPDDLVGDMPSTQEALNMPDESCNPQ